MVPLVRIPKVFLLLLLLTAACTGAELTGTIKDPDGAAVAGAKVSLQTANATSQRAVVSDAQGAFRVEVPAGVYVMRIEAAGFATLSQPLIIGESAPEPLNIRLQLGTVTTEVTASAEVGQVVELERAAQRVNVVTADEIQLRATTTLAQVAQEEMGLWQQKTSPTIGQVTIRGLNDVGVYVDGVRWTQSTQRGGISTFFNLNEPSALEAIEVLRGPTGAQYGSDSLAGTVSLTSRSPIIGSDSIKTSGKIATQYASADHSFGTNFRFNVGSRRWGVTSDLAARRSNTVRPGGGYDTHAAVTRFLGIPSTVFGERLTDTAFTQYSGLINASVVPTANDQISFRYQRGQQDGGKRYDQTLGGDGNLIADLRNLMLDFGYFRYQRQNFGVFDLASATVSYNSQREERVNQGGQGNAAAAIIHDRERTSTWGLNMHAQKTLGPHSLLIGADAYRDKVNAPSFSFDPGTGVSTVVRPRVPNGATFLQYGFFVQDSWEAIKDRLRVTGAVRYNVASYRSHQQDAPVVAGTPLFGDDSLRVADWSGRAGGVLTIVDGVNLAANYSRGFRPPNITALGSVGLVGVGYQVAASELAGRNAFIGSTAGANAVSTNIPVSSLASEFTNGYDVSLSVRRGPVYASIGGFWVNYQDIIARQTLILPAGAVGQMLGSQPIVQQDASGAVYVPLSSAPVLVQVNFGEAKVRGMESEFKWQINRAWSWAANYAYVYAEDPNGIPPNTEAGTLPPQTANFRLRFAPKPWYWVEAYSTIAGRQDRISSLGISDRRTGATRNATQVANFFRRGARNRGLIGPGPNGTFGNADDVLLFTGETLAQVQQRVLGGATSAPLYTELPGYGHFGLRGGFDFAERYNLIADFQNIGDKNYRNATWGIPAPGRSIALHLSYKF